MTLGVKSAYLFPDTGGTIDTIINYKNRSVVDARLSFATILSIYRS